MARADVAAATRARVRTSSSFSTTARTASSSTTRSSPRPSRGRVRARRRGRERVAAGKLCLTPSCRRFSRRAARTSASRRAARAAAPPRGSRDGDESDDPDGEKAAQRRRDKRGKAHDDKPPPPPPGNRPPARPPRRACTRSSSCTRWARSARCAAPALCTPSRSRRRCPRSTTSRSGPRPQDAAEDRRFDAFDAARAPEIGSTSSAPCSRTRTPRHAIFRGRDAAAHGGSSIVAAAPVEIGQKDQSPGATAVRGAFKARGRQCDGRLPLGRRRVTCRAARVPECSRRARAGACASARRAAARRRRARAQVRARAVDAVLRRRERAAARPVQGLRIRQLAAPCSRLDGRWGAAGHGKAAARLGALGSAPVGVAHAPGGEPRGPEVDGGDEAEEAEIEAMSKRLRRPSAAAAAAAGRRPGLKPRPPSPRRCGACRHSASTASMAVRKYRPTTAEAAAARRRRAGWGRPPRPPAKSASRHHNPPCSEGRSLAARGRRARRRARPRAARRAQGRGGRGARPRRASTSRCAAAAALRATGSTRAPTSARALPPPVRSSRRSSRCCAGRRRAQGAARGLGLLFSLLRFPRREPRAPAGGAASAELLAVALLRGHAAREPHPHAPRATDPPSRARAASTRSATCTRVARGRISACARGAARCSASSARSRAAAPLDPVRPRPRRRRRRRRRAGGGAAGGGGAAAGGAAGGGAGRRRGRGAAQPDRQGDEARRPARGRSRAPTPRTTPLPRASTRAHARAPPPPPLAASPRAAAAFPTSWRRGCSSPASLPLASPLALSFARATR